MGILRHFKSKQSFFLSKYILKKGKLSYKRNKVAAREVTLFDY